MEKLLKLLKSAGLELKDNRKLGMGMAIISQPSLKYISIVIRADRFRISTTGSILTVTQSQHYARELMKVNYLVKSINDALDEGL